MDIWWLLYMLNWAQTSKGRAIVAWTKWDAFFCVTKSHRNLKFGVHIHRHACSMCERSMLFEKTSWWIYCLNMCLPLHTKTGMYGQRCVSVCVCVCVCGLFLIWVLDGVGLAWRTTVTSIAQINASLMEKKSIAYVCEGERWILEWEMDWEERGS